jgi:hypothetical protein
VRCNQTGICSLLMNRTGNESGADHHSQDRQALGLTVPTALLVRADDEVIE